MVSKRAILPAVLAAALAATSLAQVPSRASVLRELGSARWQVRWQAARVLDRDAALLRDGAVQRALLAAYLRGLPEARGRGLGESDDWQAYNDAITGAILRMKRCCNPALGAKALVEAADYDPTEANGRELAADPAAYGALFTAAARPPRTGDFGRANALEVLATAYAFSLGRAVSDGSPNATFTNPNVRLRAGQRAMMRDLVWRAARNPKDPARPAAIDALGLLGDDDAGDYLQKLARDRGDPGWVQAGFALDYWYAGRGVQLTPWDRACTWLPRHPEAYQNALTLARSAAAESVDAPRALAVMYALAHGRLAPTRAGFMAAYAAAGGQARAPGGELACFLPGFRLPRSQLATIRAIVLAPPPLPGTTFTSYQAVGLLGNTEARDRLLRIARGGDKKLAFDAEIGLALWALTNGQPLPVFPPPR
ncbi:MAG: hypothetical protein ACRD2H_07665 [Terriglobales bacterium]